MNKPAISVILPVYGVEKYIEDCLHSILAQRFRDFELVLVDDGCVDSSVEIAARVLKNGGVAYRILYQSNQGQGVARDHGIRAAVGEYVVCVDPDDTLSPLFLGNLYGMIRAAHADVAFCSFKKVRVGEQLGFTAKDEPMHLIPREEMLHRFLCRTLMPILPSMLIRRCLLIERDLHARAGCRFSEDVYLIWQILDAAARTVYTPQVLYHYLVRPNSTMTAASPSRILSGYEALRALCAREDFLWDFEKRDLVLSRWVLGALNSCAAIGNYAMLMDVARKMDYRNHARALRDFPERKARILARMLLYAPRLYYWLIKNRK